MGLALKRLEEMTTMELMEAQKVFDAFHLIGIDDTELESLKSVIGGYSALLKRTSELESRVSELEKANARYELSIRQQQEAAKSAGTVEETRGFKLNYGR